MCMDFLRWISGGVVSRVLDLARCSLWGVFMSGCREFVCWLGGCLYFIGGGLVGFVVDCAGIVIFGMQGRG